MIRGLGIDLVQNERMIPHCEDHRFMKRFLHANEYAWILSSSEPREQLLASRFAVKEAFGKALGIGLRGMSLADIELIHDALGKPQILLHGEALRIFSESPAEHIHVSLTHDTAASAAVVILE